MPPVRTPVATPAAPATPDSTTAFADIDPVALEPGENSTVVVTVWNAKEVHYRGVVADDVSVSTDLGSVRPEPARVAFTDPPYWLWDAVQQTVQVSFSVSAEPSADPGQYQFEVLAWNNTNHEHTVNATIPVTVSSS